MRPFKMQEYAITDAIRFREYFSPRELLENRELAAGFVNQHFGNLSIVYRYHADVFFNTVFSKATDPVTNGNSYYELLSGHIRLTEKWKRILVKQELNNPEQKKRTTELWELVQKTSLSEEGQSALFCLLASGYSMAGKDLDSCPLTAQEAEDAYLRRKTAEEPADRWLRFAESGDICLRARKEPYRILMKQGAAALLQNGICITHRKLTALPHIQGNNGIPVILELYAFPEDPEPRRIIFYAGDYRYANFVGTVPVWFHPVHQESEACCMERRGSGITCTEKRKGRVLLEAQKLQMDIIGFVVEQHTAGWLLLTALGLDDSGYTRKRNSPVCKTDIVQAEFRGNECLLLDKHGTVYSGLRVVGTGVTALDEFQN